MMARIGCVTGHENAVAYLKLHSTKVSFTTAEIGARLLEVGTYPMRHDSLEKNPFYPLKLKLNGRT